MATFKVQFKITNVRQRVGVILYRITHNGENTSVITGIKLPEKYWNKYKASIVANNQTISYIDRIEADLLLLKRIDKRLSDKIQTYNVHEISSRFNANNEEQGFLSYMCMQILKLIQFKKLGTANNYLHTLYSFMAFLKKSSISSNVLYYTRRKTGQRLSVKIEYCMQVIIDRYNVAESEYIFPILKSDIYSKSYQQYRKAVNIYNANLKKLSLYAGLEVPLTSYVARHSWATIAQNSDVPISVISAALGHTTEQTTRIYLSAIDNSKIDEANSRIISLVEW